MMMMANFFWVVQTSVNDGEILKNAKKISIDPQLKIIEKQFTIINYLNILTFQKIFEFIVQLSSFLLFRAYLLKCKNKQACCYLTKSSNILTN